MHDYCQWFLISDPITNSPSLPLQQCRAFSKYLTSILLYVRESLCALFIIPIISQNRTSLLWKFLPTSRISQVKAFVALDYVRVYVIIRSSTNDHLPTWLPAHQHLLPSNEVGGEVGYGSKERQRGAFAKQESGEKIRSGTCSPLRCTELS